MIFLIVIILLIWLSFRYDVMGYKKDKNNWYIFMMVVFILVAGLRWRLGIDTPVYLDKFYHEYPTFDKFSIRDYGVTDSPFYVLLNSIVKTCGGRFYIVQIIHAAFVNVLIFNYIKKHSQYLFTCLFFYAIICYTSYNMEIMRASFSIVICLYAHDYFLEKKWVKGYLLYVLALMFHAQTLPWLILPMLFFLRFNKVGILALVVSFIIGNIIMNLLGEYMFLFEGDEELENKVLGYSADEKYGTQEGGLIWFAINILLWVIYVYFSFICVKRYSFRSDLQKLEPLIVLGLCFIFIRANLEIAYRYIDYFKIIFSIYFAECFIIIIKKSRHLTLERAYVISWLFFTPLFISLIGFKYFREDGQGFKYIPYSSVIERKIDKERESKYIELIGSRTYYPRANVNEY